MMFSSENAKLSLSTVLGVCLSINSTQSKAKRNFWERPPRWRLLKKLFENTTFWKRSGSSVDGEYAATVHTHHGRVKEFFCTCMSRQTKTMSASRVSWTPCPYCPGPWYNPTWLSVHINVHETNVYNVLFSACMCVSVPTLVTLQANYILFFHFYHICFNRCCFCCANVKLLWSKNDAFSLGTLLWKWALDPMFVTFPSACMSFLSYLL